MSTYSSRPTAAAAAAAVATAVLEFTREAAGAAEVVVDDALDEDTFKTRPSGAEILRTKRLISQF